MAPPPIQPDAIERLARACHGTALPGTAGQSVRSALRALARRLVACASSEATLVGLAESLERLERHDPRPHQVVVLRYFVGMTFAEIGTVLGLSDAALRLDWAYARARLRRGLALVPVETPS